MLDAVALRNAYVRPFAGRLVTRDAPSYGLKKDPRDSGARCVGAVSVTFVLLADPSPRTLRGKLRGRLPWDEPSRGANKQHEPLAHRGSDCAAGAVAGQAARCRTFSLAVRGRQINPRRQPRGAHRVGVVARGRQPLSCHHLLLPAAASARPAGPRHASAPAITPTRRQARFVVDEPPQRTSCAFAHVPLPKKCC